VLVPRTLHLRSPVTFTNTRGYLRPASPASQESYRVSSRSKRISRVPSPRIAWNVSSDSFVLWELHVCVLSASANIESRRADSNRLLLLITSENTDVSRLYPMFHIPLRNGEFLVAVFQDVAWCCTAVVSKVVSISICVTLLLLTE
jgi:hypothetical protein